MTEQERKKLIDLAAQQAEDGFAQFGIELGTDKFNELHDLIEAFLEKLIEEQS